MKCMLLRELTAPLWKTSRPVPSWHIVTFFLPGLVQDKVLALGDSIILIAQLEEGGLSQPRLKKKGKTHRCHSFPIDPWCANFQQNCGASKSSKWPPGYPKMIQNDHPSSHPGFWVCPWTPEEPTQFFGSSSWTECFQGSFQLVMGVPQ